MDLLSLNLRELLTSHFGKIKDAGEWFRVPCPTCTPSDAKKYKRYVNKRFRSSHCFICGKKLVLSELLGGVDPAVNVRRSDDYVSSGPKQEHPYTRKLPYTNAVPLHMLSSNHPAVKFMHKDHLFDLERYYKEKEIVYVPADSGVMIYRQPFISSAERIVFPVKQGGELVGWQMRSIPGTVFGDHPDCIKYCHLFPKGQYLYNYDNARQYPYVVLVEGVKKTLKFDNAVCTFGKNISPEQMQLLHGWKDVLVMLDGDDKTQELAREITRHIRANGRNALNINPSDFGFPSPDEATKEQCEEMLLTSIERNPQCLTIA